MTLADFFQRRDVFSARNSRNQLLKIRNRMSRGILPHIRRDQLAFQAKLIQSILETPKERHSPTGTCEKNIEFTHFSISFQHGRNVMGMHSFLR